MTELLRRVLHRLATAAESAFTASGTAVSRHYAPLTHPSRRA